MTSWGKHGRFSYLGSLEVGTRLKLGGDEEILIDAETYRALLAHFANRIVALGISRNPPRDSLGGWLRSRVGGELLAAYVGPILVREGVARRVEDRRIHISQAPNPL